MRDRANTLCTDAVARLHVMRLLLRQLRIGFCTNYPVGERFSEYGYLVRRPRNPEGASSTCAWYARASKAQRGNSNEIGRLLSSPSSFHIPPFQPYHPHPPIFTQNSQSHFTDMKTKDVASSWPSLPAKSQAAIQCKVFQMENGA